MSGILRLESLTKGNTLKQGDKTPLKYRLFDADGENLNIAGKSAQVRLVYPDFLTIGYEKDGLTVAQDDTVTFTIDGVIPSRIYHVEIIVDNKFVFPSRSDEAKFTVDKSSLGTEANIIEIVGVDQIVNTVLGRVDADIGQAVTDINATNEAIQQAEQERAQGYQEIQQIIEDGSLIAEPADGSLTSVKFAPKAVTPDLLSDAENIGNLYNHETDVIDVYINVQGGINEFEGYRTSDFIRMFEGERIYLTGQRFITFYDNDKSFVSGIAGDNINPYDFVAPHTGYFKVSYRHYANDIIYHEPTQFMISNEPIASYKSYGYALANLQFTEKQKEDVVSGVKLGESNLKDGAVTPRATSFLDEIISSNLFDKDEAKLGIFIDGNNNIELTGYFTSKPLYFAEETTVIINRVRIYRVMNEFGVRVDYENTGNNWVSRIVTVPARGYLDFSGHQNELNVTSVNIGTEILPYENYYKKIVLKGIEVEVETAPSQPEVEKTGEVKVTKNGENFVLESKLGDEIIQIDTGRDGSANGTFNFNNTKIGGSVVHNNGDDITPIRTFTTVGANHGYANVRTITMPNHGKNTSDLGSQWTDGTYTLTLLQINGNDLVVAPPYSVENGIVASASVNPTNALTHVSGATNVGNIDISGIKNSQLYPSVNNISVKYVLDGVEIVEDGTYYGDKLQVIEKYDIMDYKAIIDYAQANIGSRYEYGDIDGVVSQANTFTFTKGLACSTSHSLLALKKFRTSRSGFLQSVRIHMVGHVLYRTMPGISIDGYNFDVGHDMTEYNTTLIVSDNHLINANEPPSYYVDWLVDSAGNRKYGFSMGYVPDKTNSKNSDRLVNAKNNYWDLRSTYKSYPVALANLILEEGDYYSFQGFRQYLVPESDVYTNVIVEDAQDTYVYSDYKEAVGYANVEVEGVGKDIQVLQSTNFTTLSDTVNADGVPYKTTGVGSAITKV